MGNLIKFELRKLYKSKAMYIIMLIQFLLAIVEAFAVSTADYLVGVAVVDATSFIIFAPSLLFLQLILSIFIPIFTCIDYENGVSRIIVGHGYNRLNCIIAKYIAAAIATVNLIVFDFVIAGVSIWVAQDKNPMKYTAMEVIAYILGEIIIVIAEMTLYYAISMLIRKKGLAIATCIVGVKIFSFALMIIESLMKYYHTFGSLNIDFSKYWVTGLLTLWTGSKMIAEDGMIIILLLSVIYTIIFLSGAIGFSLKRDE